MPNEFIEGTQDYCETAVKNVSSEQKEKATEKPQLEFRNSKNLICR